MSWFRRLKPMSDDEFRRQRDEILRQAPVPLIWLFGKTGSGKSSIIRYLTGVPRIEIGNGFRPQTRVSSTFDFPTEQAQLLRFLDTRGLGEAGYEAALEVDEFTRAAHFMIVVVRVLDHALAEVIHTLRRVRNQNPRRPVLLVLTCLHDAWPEEQHPDPDPFDGQGHAAENSIPGDLQRSLQHHRLEFDGLVDRVVPVDFTDPDEGFQEPNFGGTRLKQAILDMMPAAYRDSLLRMEQTRRSLKELQQQRVAPMILGYSTLAASAAAVPLPWVDIPMVLAAQTRLIYRLAEMHQQPVDALTIAQVSGAVGGRIALRMAARELLKIFPWVGSAINAATAFAYTYATGMAWNWYFTEVQGGHVPTPGELNQVFQAEISRGAKLWQVARPE